MLDIQMFRTEGAEGLDLVLESEGRRNADPAVVQRVVTADKEWRAARGALDKAQARLNALGAEIGSKMKQKDKKAAREECKDLFVEQSALKEEIKALKVTESEAIAARSKALFLVGNIIHDSVPVAKTEDDNLVIRTSGEFKELIPGGRPHHELLEMIDGYASDQGVAIAGHRAYFLKGIGVKLQMALVNYALNFLMDEDYVPLIPPFFMNKDIMEETAELAQFDEELYKVSGDSEEKYLIATSEQPISAFHRGEWIHKDSLPLKYAGYSSCFRKEAGSHGKDTWGIFRVHQFEKVEQFVLTKPEDSWAMLEAMISHSEKFFESLGIPFRTIAIVSSALNKAAAKKYDVEAWYPSFQEFKEVVSCSNCTDYQARRLGVRYGQSGGKGDDNRKMKEYVHMLNGTMCAATRAICAILENHQTPEGINIPEVLLPYMHMKPQADGSPTTFIPFVKEYKPRN